MAVEDAAHRIADGLVEIVALHQDGEESGNRPAPEIPGALEDLRQQVKHRRRVALLAGWFAGGETDLALGHGEAGDRIHDQQNVGSLVAEILRDGQGDEAGADAQRGGTVARGANHHRTLASLGPELIFEEAADFPIAFADHRNHRDVGRVVARHGAEQRALSDAAAAEDADALTFAARQQGVDGADAGDQRLGDVLAVERVGGGTVEAVGIVHFDLGTVVHRLAETVDDAAKQSRTHFDARLLTARRQRNRPTAGRRFPPAAWKAPARRGSRSPGCECVCHSPCGSRRNRRWRRWGREIPPAGRPPPSPGRSSRAA